MSFRLLLPWFLVLLIFVIGAAHATALRYHLFYTYWWLDIPMHILGGFWVSLFALWYHVVFRHHEERGRDKRKMLIHALSVTFSIAIGWELFEYAMNAYIVLSRYDMMDTLKDLLMGIIGAIIGAQIFNYNIHKHTAQ